MNKQDYSFAEIIAQVENPDTSSQRLEEIYRNSSYYFYEYYRREKKEEDKLILRKLTTNPQTPLEILVILGEHFPIEFMENPVLDLYFLVNPNLFVELPFNTKSGIYVSFGCDYSFPWYWCYGTFLREKMAKEEIDIYLSKDYQYDTLEDEFDDYCSKSKVKTAQKKQIKKYKRLNKQ